MKVKFKKFPAVNYLEVKRSNLDNGIYNFLLCLLGYFKTHRQLIILIFIHARVSKPLQIIIGLD